MNQEDRDYLLDTNILVELIRMNKLGQAVESKYQLRSTSNRCAISIVTVGEMLALALKWKWGSTKRKELSKILDQLVWIDLNDSRILDAYGLIAFECESHGRALGQNDLWIAATAHVSRLTLLTTDQDFLPLSPHHLQVIQIDPNTK